MRSGSSLVFLVFCLILLIGILRVDSHFKEYFGEARDLTAQAQQLRKTIEKEKLRTELVRAQLFDFKQQVAEVLPNSSKDFRTNELIQAVRWPASETIIDSSSVLMAKGAEEFKNNRYDKAANIFREVIEKYPVSSKIIEAYFLLGESLFQNMEYEACLDAIQDMVTFYPESEMTGYLMLRNAQILKQKKRTSEAQEIYSLILQQFSSNHALKEQARKLASEP